MRMSWIEGTNFVLLSVAAFDRVPGPILSITSYRRILSPELELSVVVGVWMSLDVVVGRVIFWITSNVDSIGRLVDSNYESKGERRSVDDRRLLNSRT